jgi:hypothetical protein
LHEEREKERDIGLTKNHPFIWNMSKSPLTVRKRFFWLMLQKICVCVRSINM